MLMYKDDGGFHNFGAHEVEQAVKDGWVDGTAIREKLIAAKRQQGVAIPSQSDTIQEHEPAKRRGRPRKEVQSDVTEPSDGNRSDDN